MININAPTSISQGKTCVALGNFDGVHIGHRRIISASIRQAKITGLLSCVYTFSTHPSEFLGNVKPILTSHEEKRSLIEELNVDILYIDDFSSVRNMSPHDFCTEVLRDKLNAECVFCGENYTFGHMGKGDVEILRKILQELNIQLVVVPYVYTDDDTIVSSTLIRKLISDGKVDEASNLMHSYYSIKGKVMHGKKLGRKLGFPTLNIAIPAEKAVPKFGVYISMCKLDGKLYKGITNIGVRPTTDKGTATESFVNCETYLFDYSEDAYDKEIAVYLFKMIRPEISFNSIEELKDRISKDKIIAEELLINYNPTNLMQQFISK